MPIPEYRTGGILIRLIKLLFRKWYMLAASAVSVIIYANTVSVGPVIIKYAIDYGITVGNIDVAVKYSLILMGVTALGAATWFITRYLTALLSQELAHYLRVKAFESIHQQSMEFFDRMAVGQLISRITNDTNRLARTLSWQIRNIVNLSFTAGLSLYYMFTMSPRLSYIILLAIVIMALTNARYVTLIRPLYDRIRNQLGVLASIVTSNLNGIRTVKALALEDHEIHKFTGENNEFANLNLRVAKVRATYGNAPQLVLGVTLASVLYLGGSGIVAGSISVGELTAFITYLTLLMWPMRALGFTISAFQRSLAAAKRVFEIIDAEPEVKDDLKARKLDDIKGEIVFDHVTFYYTEKKPALLDVSFRVAPREKIFLTGPPGAGKSTILKLLMRFYEVRNGRILIDGCDIRQVEIKSLRDHIALVPQEPFIFSGTVKENIAFGNPDASMEDIVRAAKAAKIHDFISSLPDGYNTVIGERGITLSGGQRQRIAIARALVKRPKILLLDDPVSNLDTETEKKLIDDLKKILRGMTVIIVGQRISLATLADRILVLDQGRIVEEGTHKELVSRSGLYYKLYTTSVGGGS